MTGVQIPPMVVWPCASAALRAQPGCSTSGTSGRVPPRPARRAQLPVSAVHADYQAKASDDAALRRPLKMELRPEEITRVFGYPRDLSDRYRLGSVLGAGSFGVVRECVHKASGRRFAVKSIPKTPKNGKSTPRYLLKLQTEVDAMQQLGGSLDSVYLQDVFEDDSSVHLVMELCEGGSVLDGLKEGDYSERQVASIMRSVLRFVAQCHAKGIIYRDIKPDNFLLVSRTPQRKARATDNGGGNPLWKIGQALGVGSAAPPKEDLSTLLQPPDSSVKATDFGLSIRHRPEDPPLKSRSGTPAYMAPEVIQQSYNEAADIWSAGIMMYQLLTGKFPFWDNVRDCTLQQVWKSILTDRINWSAPELRDISPQAKDLLQRMLERSPSKRIKAADALRHPWLSDVDGSSTLPLRRSVVQRLQRFATYGHLKQLVLRIIADELGTHPEMQRESQDLVDNLITLFQELDEDSNGTVSMDELVGGLKRLGYSVSASEIYQLMSRVDVNHDGSLELSEFVAGLVDWSLLQNDKLWSYWVQLAWDRLDTNKDGYISLEELMAQLPIDDGSSDTERMLEAKRMLREADVNGDGRISQAEFRELLLGTTLPDTLHQYDSRLNRLEALASTVVDEDLHSSYESVVLGSGEGGPLGQPPL